MANDGDPYQTGSDAVLKVGGTEYAITNVSYTKDVGTTEVQMNDSLKPRIAVTDLRFSGSFEHEGDNESLRAALEYTDATSDHEAMEPRRPTISVIEEHDGTNRVVTFENAVVTSRSRDFPSDDSASASYDFVAEDMVVS